MAELRCPDCAVTLQVLFVERGGGQPDMKVDRCPQCAGLWFEAGELEQALSKSVPHDALGAPTERRCPFCTTTMETALLPGAVPAETCASCRGVWLDAGELEELGGAEPRRRQQPAAGVSGGDFDGELEFEDGGEVHGGFECASCKQRTPFSDAHGTAKGLVCGRCTPQVQDLPAIPQIELTRPSLTSRYQLRIVNLSQVLKYFF